MLHSYREIDVSWQVSIFADTFAATLPPQRWADELLLTVFHEYIHYFESFLLRSEQPLRSREEGHHGVAERALSLDEARRQDRRIIRRRRIWRACLIAIPLLIAAAILAASIRIESDEDRTQLSAALAQNEALIARLEALESTRASIESNAARLPARDPALSVEALESAARQSCPGAGVKPIGGIDAVLVTSRGDLRGCLAGLHRSAPRAAIASVNLGDVEARLLVKTMRGGGLDAAEVRRPWRAPHVSTDEGDRLRAALAASAQIAQRLKARVTPLAQTAQRIAAFEAPPWPALSPLLDGWPADVKVLDLRRVDGGYEVRVEGPGAADWVRAQGPSEDRVTVWGGGWVLVAAKSRRDLAGRMQHSAWFARL